MRRGAKSVPANIAEGFSRKSTARDFRLFLSHALGSANEMLVHIQIAEQLDYISKETRENLDSPYTIVAKQLNRLMRNWR
jgi:four helix bundle protein